MFPIRVALVGLSSSAKTSWAADAHLTYLLSPRGKKHYEIVALLNSSIAAAQAAIKAFALPVDTKAYGDPDSLAEDADVDLVVVNTRADLHYTIALPSIRAGKAVWIEWPLTHSLLTSLDLASKLHDPRNSIVGLQGRVMPITLRLQALLAEGAIGKVLSSDVRAFGTFLARDVLPSSLAYFADRDVGGHPINIHYGHMIDYVHAVLGKWAACSAQMQIQRSELRISNTDTGTKGEKVKSNIPDLLHIHGTLRPTKGITVPGATLAAHFRTGPPFPGTPGFEWTINGEKGELRITAPGPMLMSGDSYDGPVTIQLHEHESGEVRDVTWEWPEWQRELGLRTRNTGEVYERYAEWVGAGKGEVREGREWPRVGDGVELMREFEELFRGWEGI